MKGNHKLYLLISLLLGVTVQANIVLPVRVMGKVGTIKSVVVPVENKNQVAKLWLKTHNVAYENKMAVRINGGDWIRVNNNTVELSEKSIALGGIGGHENIHKFTIDVTGIVDGDNNIEFRFNKGDGVTQGFRILNINFLDNGGNNLIDKNFFSEEDPTTWKPILDNPTDIEAGRKLFQDVKVPDLKVVSCSDCHTTNGYDLKYFGYSDFAIMTSAQLHGYTEKQAQQIASFIRSRPIETLGRPWNPPYQPGPQLDGKPIEAWAAGAGIDAVLETDDQMHEHLFPNGTSMDEIRKVVNLEGNLDVTELPIAIPLFEWNRWMQRAHPFQIWPNGEFKRGPYQTYLKVLAELQNNRGDNYISSGKIVSLLDNLQESVKNWIGEGKTNTLDNWRGEDGTNLDARDPQYSREEAKLRLMQWVTVRYFEFMKEYDIESRAHLFFGTDGNGEGHRQWPMDQRSIFEACPHFLADDINAFAFNNQPLVVGKLWSSAWYQAQMLINSGDYDMSVKGAPMDWTYHYTHIWDAQIAGAPLEGYRTISSIIEMWQERTNGKMGHDGWRWRYMHPMYMWSDEYGDTSNFAMLNTHDSDLRRKLSSAMLEEWIRELRKFPIEDWPRTEPGEKEDWVTIKDESHVPSAEIDNLGAQFFWAASKQNHADYMYKLIPELVAYKIEPTVVNDIIDWCAEAWPLGDWEKWKQHPVGLVKADKVNTFTPIISMKATTLNVSNIKPGTKITVYDLKGRILLSQSINSGSFQWKAPSAGIRIMTLQLPGNSTVKSYKFTSL